ncbi:ead/Ea22-like family protein [Klebsiella quasivariicola]|uniref:ead/Ea22-like family protein n=1 Tax=Klebsiella quasivariicola TaxID=2026240 RepID=UPI0018A260FF|nr:ead/Ea22-like family protein [Klebsiella quasivariicola]MBF7823483.1 ead/Ea22-like family protein [Klebsiella quasivariicola]
MTGITELAQRMRTAAEKATPGQWERGDGKNGGKLLVYCDDAVGSAVCEATSGYNAITKYQRIDNLDFIALANPANILALVEALEKAQAKNALVASLISENAALKGSVENAAGCINAAYAEGLIDVLAESSDERLVDLVKRRLLHAYLPVETPATDDVLVAMGDAVLLEQLEDSRKAIVSQSYIIDIQDKRNVELDSHKAALLKFISDSCYVFDGYDADISDAYVDAITSGLMPKLESVASCNPPLYWVRVKSDGGYDGPIHDSKLEDVRKKSGEWLPLTLARGG